MGDTGKFQGSVIAGAVTTIVIWALDTYVLPSPLPPEIAAAVATLISAAGAFFTPHDSSVANLIPKGSPNVTKVLPFILVLAVATALTACSSTSNPVQTVNTKVIDPLITDLSRIGNTSTADLTVAENVANAATPPDKDGFNCAAAAITVQGQINGVMQAAAVPNAGVFTMAELSSLFQPGSAQYNNAKQELITGCAAKAQDVLGPTALLATGVVGAMAVGNQVLPLAAAVP